MGLYSDYLEANRNRESLGYIDPCLIVWAQGQGADYNIKKYRAALERYDPASIDENRKVHMHEEFLKKSIELERLKSGYLIAEKNILEIINRDKLQSTYMRDMVNVLQDQLQRAYRSICRLRSDIDKKVKLKIVSGINPKDEDSIRSDILERLIKSTIFSMEKGAFQDASIFKIIVSDCAEIIRCLEEEDYNQSNKMILKYYLIENIGLREGHFICKNCGCPLLADIPFCLNCYERND